MVRHALLAPIVRPDLVAAAHARDAHDADAQPGFLVLARLAPQQGHFRPQHLPRLGAVLVLRARVLDRDHGGGGDVRQPDGRVGGVDVLPAGAARAHHVRAHVRGRDVVVARGVVEGFFAAAAAAFVVAAGEAGQHEHGGGGRVRAALGLGRGHPLHAVHAGFALQHAVGARLGDLEDGFLDLVEVGGRLGGFGRGAGVEFHERDGERVPLAEGLVHAQEVPDEDAGFGTAGAGPDLEEAGVGGEGVGGDEARLEGGEEGGELGRGLLNLVGGEGAEFGVIGRVLQEVLELGDGLSRIVRLFRSHAVQGEITYRGCGFPVVQSFGSLR